MLSGERLAKFLSPDNFDTLKPKHSGKISKKQPTADEIAEFLNQNRSAVLDKFVNTAIDAAHSQRFLNALRDSIVKSRAAEWADNPERFISPKMQAALLGTTGAGVIGDQIFDSDDNNLLNLLSNQVALGSLGMLATPALSRIPQFRNFLRSHYEDVLNRQRDNLDRNIGIAQKELLLQYNKAKRHAAEKVPEALRQAADEAAAVQSQVSKIKNMVEKAGGMPRSSEIADAYEAFLDLKRQQAGKPLLVDKYERLFESSSPARVSDEQIRRAYVDRLRKKLQERPINLDDSSVRELTVNTLLPGALVGGGLGTLFSAAD